MSFALDLFQTLSYSSNSLESLIELQKRISLTSNIKLYRTHFKNNFQNFFFSNLKMSLQLIQIPGKCEVPIQIISLR